MTDNGNIMMTVCWKEQTRLIEIKSNDNINEIEKTIRNSYYLEQVNQLNEYQIQYYDNDYQRFIDLYPGVLNRFRQLLRKLLSPEAPAKSTEEWRLRIVSKTIENTHHTLHKSTTDDNMYSFQQVNDDREYHNTDTTVAVVHNPPDVIRSTPIFVIGNPENLPIVLTPPANTGDQRRPNHITTDHPYGCCFDRNLADHQRSQFETDIIPKNPLKRKTIRGVLLRASDNTTPNDETHYPIVHFQIPTDMLHSHWFLYVYILTELDRNDIHYLHASKGVFDNATKREERFGIITDTECVNPYVVPLSADDISSGRRELFLKICNIKNLPTLKHEQLRKFPQLNSTIRSNDQTLLSTQTSDNLKLSNDKYHLGCILVCDNIAYDLCISSLTENDKKRGREDGDKQKQRDDANEGKKQRQT